MQRKILLPTFWPARKVLESVLPFDIPVYYNIENVMEVYRNGVCHHC